MFKTVMILEPAKKKWVMDAPKLIKPLVTMIHGPMIKWLQNESDSKDKALVRHLQNGFPVIGQFPTLTEACTDKPWNLAMWSKEELLQQRQTTNSEVLRAVKETENQEEVMKAIMESVQVGRISTPRQIQSDHLHKYFCCRRIDVVEYREYEVDEVSM